MAAIKTKHVKTVTVTDPDSGGKVEVEIRKLETGGMVGIDGSYLEQDVGTVYSPYDRAVKLEIPDDETAVASMGSNEALMHVLALLDKLPQSAIDRALDEIDLGDEAWEEAVQALKDEAGWVDDAEAPYNCP